MIRRRDLMVGALGATVLTAPGCAKLADRSGMTVILDWLLNANHAALFAALQTGAFQKASLDVKLIAPADPDSPCKLVAARQADLAVSYGSQINMIADAGLPLVRIASLIDSPLNTIAAIGGGRIRALSDLKGKKVGISVGGVEEALLDAMLHSAGLKPSDVTVVKVNYDMVTALISNQLDAAIGAYRNAEVLQLRQLGKDPIVFLPEEHGVPAYDELILVARRDRLGDPRLKAFVAALGAGAAALLKAPEPLWRAFAQAHPELATPLNHAAWNATLPHIALDPSQLDSQRYLAFQSFALAQGIIHKALPLDEFAVRITT
jgi:putative hydroxymethylpyrimidine transport system substrate-binding protein